MSTIHNLSGYGPKNAPEQTREPKVNLSFAHKLPKADFKDVPGMNLYLDVLTQVLPSVSMPAAALARGYDFKNVDEDDMVTELMHVDTSRLRQADQELIKELQIGCLTTDQRDICESFGVEDPDRMVTNQPAYFVELGELIRTKLG